MKRFTAIFRALIVASVVVSAAVCISPAAQAAMVKLKANLRASSEVPPTTGQGRGRLTATLNTDTNELTYRVTYEHLTGPAMAAHFHGPAAPGANAGPQVPVAKPLDSPISGMAMLTPEQAKDLMAGMWYFNIHTMQNPGGEIRGQITK